MKSAQSTCASPQAGPVWLFWMGVVVSLLVMFSRWSATGREIVVALDNATTSGVYNLLGFMGMPVMSHQGVIVYPKGRIVCEGAFYLVALGAACIVAMACTGKRRAWLYVALVAAVTGLVLARHITAFLISTVSLGTATVVDRFIWPVLLGCLIVHMSYRWFLTPSFTSLNDGHAETAP